MSPRPVSSRHTITVEIAGEKHVLRSDVSPEYTREVAAHVDATIRALGDAQPLDSRRTVTLAALFITDELFRAREELRALREEIESRAAALAVRLERAVTEGAAPPPPARRDPKRRPPPEAQLDLPGTE